MANLEILQDIKELEEDVLGLQQQSNSNTIDQVNNVHFEEDIIYQRLSDIQYMPQHVTLPDILTKHIICEEQTLTMHNMLGEFVASLLTEDVGIITHDSALNQMYELPSLKIIPYNAAYYFTIRVDRISASAPTLQLINHNSTNTAVTIKGLTAKTGIHKLSCIAGGNSNYTTASILTPQIGITDEDVQNGRYISYEILGVYNRDILLETENFIGDIKFSGDALSTNDSTGCTITLNNVSTKIPYVFRNFYGLSDYIRENRLYRRIKKIQVTADMVYLYEPQWVEGYKIGAKSSYVFLKSSLNYGVNNPVLPIGAGQYYVWSPTLTTHPLSGLSNYGKDVDIRCITTGKPYGESKTCIVVKLKNSDINVAANANLTASEIVQKYQTWFTEHPTYIYYACTDETVETINFTLPTLLGDKNVNTLTFSSNTSLGIYPHIKVKRRINPYMNLDGKAWLCIGDSLTQAQGSTLNYTLLASMLIPNCITYNLGYGGSSICDYDNTAVHWGTWIDSHINDTSLFPEHVDLITIMLGVNDRKTSLVLGTIEDIAKKDIATGYTASTSFYAMYKHLIIMLLNKYPLAEIVILSPPRLSYYSDTGVIGNADNNTYTDIIEAVRKIAGYFNLRYIDLNQEGGISNLTPNSKLSLANNTRRNYWLTPDGLHYNNLAHQLLFKRLVQEL